VHAALRSEGARFEVPVVERPDYRGRMQVHDHVDHTERRQYRTPNANTAYYKANKVTTDANKAANEQGACDCVQPQ